VSRYAQRTEVGSDKTRVEIEKTLRRYGATAFAYGWQDAGATIGFTIANRSVRIELPLPSMNDPDIALSPAGRTRSDEARERAYEQAIRQRWRALALIVKAKLEAVEAGISTVEREFLADVMLADGTTVGAWAAPQLALVYERGGTPALLPGGGS
jgi:hypothetical protein